jgi:cysteine-S-conjugate beta-lyase
VEAAYGKGEPWLEELLNYLQENLRFIETTVKENLPKAKFTPPKATYLAWIDLRDYGLSDKELEKKLTEKGRVALDGGSWFGRGGEGFVRINFACPRRTLGEALERIIEAIEEE